MPKDIGKTLGILASIAAIIGTCIAVIALIPAFGQWQNSREPRTNTQSNTPVAINPPNVSAPQPTVEQPTQRAAPTQARPTDTPLPTSVPATPTNLSSPTPKAFYNQGEAVYLQETKTITLLKDFGVPYWSGCSDGPGFVVELQFDDTGRNNFVLRYDNMSTFSATDDTGKTYRYMGSGVGHCDMENGITNIETYGSMPIAVGFSGQIPLEAHYLIITVKGVLGSGQIVFHKGL